MQKTKALIIFKAILVQGANIMSIYTTVKQILDYLLEAALEVFSPDHDDYPATGIQPFEGEIYSEF
ncbi:MAG: hypothetical protein ACEQSC_00445 [Candidatus Nanopelagicaceae bacterium]|jgi:hypothetical protein